MIGLCSRNAQGHNRPYSLRERRLLDEAVVVLSLMNSHISPGAGIIVLCSG